MKAVIFDFDGVIHDTLELGYNVNIKTTGKKISKDEYRAMFDGNLYSHKEVTPEKSRLFFEIAMGEYAKLIMERHIREELLLLSKKYSLFIITSNKEEILHQYMTRSRCDVFKQILGFETHTSKVEKFNMLLQNHNLKREDCVFVTDTLGDILEANNIGIKTIAVDFGFHDREKLQRGNPAAIISDFKEILPVVEELSRKQQHSPHNLYK